MEIVYSSADAQRSHWKDVKKFMRPLTDRDEGIKAGRQFWDTKNGETSILFKHITNVPFDDLDDIEANGWSIGEKGAGDDSCGSVEMRFPSPSYLNNGEVNRPRVEGELKCNMHGSSPRPKKVTDRPRIACCFYFR